MKGVGIMYASFGNTANIDTYKANKRDIRPYSFSPVDVKRAQYVLDNNNDVPADQWNDLCKRLYKSIIQSSLQGGKHLDNATSVILNWDSKVASRSLLDLRRFIFMEKIHNFNGDISSLSEWQVELIQSLMKDKNVKYIWGFNDSDIDVIWAITEDASTKKVLEYNKLFFNVLDNYPNVNCDFMVYSMEEVTKINVPKLLYSINVWER